MEDNKITNNFIEWEESTTLTEQKESIDEFIDNTILNLKNVHQDLEIIRSKLKGLMYKNNMKEEK